MVVAKLAARGSLDQPCRMACRARSLTALACWLLIASTLIVGFAPARQALADAYAVSGIAVDVDAENAVLARSMAIEEAQLTGLRQLLERLTLPQYFDQLPAADLQSMSRLVTAFEVEEESTSRTRYVGELNVAYDPLAVQNLLQGTAVPIVVDLPPPLLIIPAVEPSDGTLEVFGDDAAWRDAWAEEASTNTLLDIRLPLGDLSDLRMLSGDMLATDLETTLATAAERYGTDGALLIVARPDDPLSPGQIDVRLAGSQGWSTGYAGDTVVGAPVASALETDDADLLWNTAVRRTMQSLENEWKAANLVAMDRLARLPIQVPISNFEEWTDVHRRLTSVAAIRKVEMRAFSQQSAELVLDHIGNIDQLRRALEARGLSLSQGTGTWRLQRTAGPRAG